MEGVLEQLAGQVEHRLVELDLRGRTLTLKVRWSDFQLVTRSVSRIEPCLILEPLFPTHFDTSIISSGQPLIIFLT